MLCLATVSSHDSVLLPWHVKNPQDHAMCPEEQAHTTYNHQESSYLYF